jgi:hypothetical protein
VSWHDKPEPAVYAPGERARELEGVARTRSGDFASANVYHTCGLRSGVCAACECDLKRASEQAVAAEEGRKCCCVACDQPRPAACRRIAELERELRVVHQHLRASLDREQQVLRERLKLELQLAAIRCLVCKEGSR